MAAAWFALGAGRIGAMAWPSATASATASTAAAAAAVGAYGVVRDALDVAGGMLWGKGDARTRRGKVGGRTNAA